MSIFSDTFKDLTEFWSPIGKLRTTLADLTKLLREYSTGCNKLPDELIRLKIIVAVKECLEISKKCQDNEIVRLYFEKETIELSVEYAIKAAEYWVEEILEGHKIFTYSLAISLIEKAKYDINQNKNVLRRQVISQLRICEKLPILVTFLEALNAKNIIENSTRLECNFPYQCPDEYKHLDLKYYLIIEEVEEDLFNFIIKSTFQNVVLFLTKQSFNKKLSLQDYGDMFFSLVNNSTSYENGLKLKNPDQAELQTCPKCYNGKLLKGKTAYSCSAFNNGCNFKIEIEFGGKKISPKQLQVLIKRKKSPFMNGFMINGKKVSGHLILNPNLEIEFVEE